MGKNWIKQLKWYLEFIGKDLNSAKPSERAALAHQLACHTYKNFFLKALFEEERIRIDKEFKKGFTLLKFDKMFSDEMEQILLVMKFLEKNLDDLQETLRNLSDKIFNLADILVEKSSNSEQQTIDDGTLNKNRSIDEHGEAVISLRANAGRFYVAELFDNHDQKKIIIHDFIKCFHGVQLDDFAKCPECDNWFVNPTKRRKIYCTNKCATRFITRENRRKTKEANPKKHQEENEKGRKRSRKSYEKRVRKTNPNAKIGRNPRKPKGD